MLRRKDVDRILGTMLHARKGVSDLNFTPGKPLQVESSGQLVKVDFQPPVDELTPFQSEMFALSIVGNNNRANLETLVKTGSVDCAYELAGECRFRVNVFQQRSQYSMVLRKLESKIMSMDELGLPEIFRDMAGEKTGLILVTGATGSGKSTTLAALLNEMNETRAIHILTIEDPIEYVHPHKKATFNQRELGTDFDTFHSSLRAALRQAPKVILVGESRDRETMEMALDAASTGHLVLTTLHSIDCGQTINRVIGLFEKEEEEQIRARLSECLRYVVNQRLLPKLGGGRVPSQEIMGVNLRVRELLINGESEGKTFYDIIGVSRSKGWMTHDQCIAEAYEAGKITEETAMAYGSNKPVLARMLDRIKQERGEEDKDALQLTLDTSAAEAKQLFARGWPKGPALFPLQKKHGPANVIIYEPDLQIEGSEVAMSFPVKVQGLLPSLTLPSTSGSMMVTAGFKGSGSMVSVSGYKFKSLNIDQQPLSPKVGQDVMQVLHGEFPESLDLPNPKFTTAKKEALQRLSEIGKVVHLLQLKELREKAFDQAEIDAISETIKAIEARS